MSKEETKSMNKYFNLPNPGLRAYLNIVEEGQADEYRTTFYKGKSVQDVLDSWMEHLSPLKTQWPTLYEFEEELASKVGPMSIMKPVAQRMDDIESYYTSILKDAEPVDESAVAAVKREWSKYAGLRLKSQLNTVRDMKKSTNSGSPYFTKRKLVVDKTIPTDIKIVGDDIFLVHANKEYLATAVLGWRGQEGGPSDDDVKQRVVWMFPFGVNIRELQVYQPLITAAQKGGLVPAWIGMDAVDRAVTNLFDTKDPNDLIICTDFTKFDQHFNSSLQLVAYAVLDDLFRGDHSMSTWLRDVFPVKYNIPLCYGWGKFRTGKHGMGSGSGGTNADETIAHRALQYEAALRNNATLNPNSQCLGDDGILSYRGCAVEDVVRAYSSHGLEMNTDKQYASKQDCTYLRRWHHEAYRVNGICVGVYATSRALGRLCEQERYYDPEIWGPKMVALRQLSILENVKFHPLKEEFVDYCIKGDKFRLGLDIPGFFDNIAKIAKDAVDQMPDFLGYTKTLQNEAKPSNSYGIENWWIVQYLKSKAYNDARS